MELEWLGSRDNDATGSSDLQVPGLPVDGVVGVALWHSQARGSSAEGPGRRYGACLAEATERFSAACLSRGTNCGWVSTVVLFPGQLEAYTAAGWISGDRTARVSSMQGTMTLWSQLPQPESEDWRHFWNVPIDPIYTNVILLRRGWTGEVPPSSASRAIAGPLATYLQWPWLPSLEAQRQWLGSVADHLVGLALGIDSCRLGIQFVVPVRRARFLRQVVTKIVEELG